MANIVEKLSDSKIRAIKASEALKKLTDGKGLQLWITPQNGRYWRFDYRFGGKRKLLALGTYPDVSLASARRKAQTARELVARQIDPSEERKQQNRAGELEEKHSFSAVAARLVKKKRTEGRAEVTLKKMEWILAKVEGDLGRRPISQISTPEIITVLQREEDLGNLETARRMRSILGEVFRYSIQTGISKHDPVGATRGALARPRTKHHAAIIEPKKLGDLLHLIDGYSDRNYLVGTALKLMTLIYPRPGELRQADWSEFALTAATWTIPATRMKMRQSHSVPLSKQAVELLRELHVVTGPNGFVFPAIGRGNRCMSENTMNVALRKMGIAGDVQTSHGFRATASTLLNATGLFSSDAIERSLAHQDKDAVRRAYARGDAMTERREMAQWWGDYLDQLRALNSRS
ncbi:MAG: integrase arm-type DNA-binding domain-containing protein [Aestuariivirga sp.]